MLFASRDKNIKLTLFRICTPGLSDNKVPLFAGFCSFCEFFFHSLHLSCCLRASWQQPLVVEPIVPVGVGYYEVIAWFLLWFLNPWLVEGTGRILLPLEQGRCSTGTRCSRGGLLISCPLHGIIVIPTKVTTFRLVRSYCWGNHLNLRKSDCANGTGKGAPGFAKPWEAQGLELPVWHFPAPHSWWDPAWSSCAWPSPGTWPFPTLNMAVSWVL